MTDVNPTLPPAGWYPDPAGSNRTRWWNGFGWSDTYGEPTAPVAPAAPVHAPASGAAASPGYSAGPYSAAPHSAAPHSAAPHSSAPYSPAPYSPAPYSTAPYSSAPYSSAPGYAAPQPLVAPAGTSPYTPWIWLLALLPIPGLVDSLFALGSFDRIASVSPDSTPYGPGYFVSLAITWGTIALSVLFGVLDWRALNRAGVPRPFHWAWIFFAIVSAPVYMVGRTIVMRRRVGSGWAPMIVNLVLAAIGVVVFVMAIVIGFQAALESGIMTGAGA